MIQLQHYELYNEVFDYIVNHLGKYLLKMEDISPYLYGYKYKYNKNLVMYNGTQMIIKECTLAYYVKKYNAEYSADIKAFDTNDWSQCIVKRVFKNDSGRTLETTISGSYAYNYIMRIIKKYYTTDEIDEIFKDHESDYSDEWKQYHYIYIDDPHTITKHTNCVKYDINGAHTDAIIYLFPKAKEDLMAFYMSKFESPSRKKFVKQVFNFFVGELCNKGHRLTYNWIVQRTTHTLKDAMEFVGGKKIYANTDGFCVMNPSNLLTPSTELGAFKLEAEGDIYTYSGDNYTIMQFTNMNNEVEMCGILPLSLRRHIDLPNGKVVKYSKVKVEDGFTYENVERVNAPCQVRS